MEIGKAFNSISSYNENMAKHMMDKLFWLKYVPDDKPVLYVDFGCADGTMLNYLREINHNEGRLFNTYIGYDICDTMINLAKTNFNGDKGHFETVEFVSSWDKVKEIMDTHANKTKHKVLILSSVIHEVYSYAKSGDEVDEFWDRVLNSGFDQIMVRDMMITYDTCRPADEEDILQIRMDRKKVLSDKQLFDFEWNWGTIKDVNTMIHFLLKYRWKINWEREVNENYFPIFVEDFLELMVNNGSNYKIDYFEHFRIPFLENEIKKDFDIKLEDDTHIKAVFSLKKNIS